MDKEIAEKIVKVLNKNELNHLLEDDISEVVYQLSIINSKYKRLSSIRDIMNDAFYSIDGLIDYIELEDEDASDILEVLERHFLKWE